MSRSLSRLNPFEFVARWPQLATHYKDRLTDELIELLDRRDRDLEDYLTAAQRPIMVYHQTGALQVDSSDKYLLPYAPRSHIFGGNVTTYGSGTVTAKLMRNATIVATLTITAAGLFTVKADIQWEYEDQMWVDLTAIGTGNSGFVSTVI